MTAERFELEVVRSPALPRAAGWYLAWPAGSPKPMVLPWARLSTCWRAGAQRIAVDAWAGPLPELQPQGDSWDTPGKRGA